MLSRCSIAKIIKNPTNHIFICVKFEKHHKLLYLLCVFHDDKAGNTSYTKKGNYILFDPINEIVFPKKPYSMFPRP